MESHILVKEAPIDFWAFGNQCIRSGKEELIAYIYDGANLHYKLIRFTGRGQNLVELI